MEVWIKIPEGCSLELGAIVCREGALRELLREVRAAARTAEAEVEARKLARLEEENQRLRAELETWRELGSKVLARVEGALAELEKVEDAVVVARELERLRGALEAALKTLEAAREEVERWRSAWICYYVAPHEEPVAYHRDYSDDGLPKLAGERFKELARKVKKLREKWYAELLGMPLVRLGKVFIAFSEAAARRFEQKYDEIFGAIVEQLRALGYQTHAMRACLPMRMMPQQIEDLVREEIERTRGELVKVEEELAELSKSKSSYYRALDKARRLRAKLHELETLLRSLAS